MPESLSGLEKRIKSLQVQGAKNIAIESLIFLRTLVKKKGFRNDFREAVKRLEKTRPTAVVLHNCLEEIKKEKDVKAIERLLRQLKDADKQIALKGRGLIKDKTRIMTRCHSSEALALIKYAWKDRKKMKVYATETRPKWQGVKTANELAKLGIPVTLIVDSAMGFFIDDVDMVIVGTDAMRNEGFVNKIGTYMLALLCKEHKKPLYVVGDTLKLDKRKYIQIEERDPDEVYKENLKNLYVRNPAFDITPWKYVKRVITEKGVMTPGNIKKLL
ncbi:MAG: translation initiation factor eIF-2B [Candidatus Aenigmarchaeota archaeon]|nr:translation initiation factor eIF-2B [Candidatus Aenigmarchaeota archaeon]